MIDILKFTKVHHQIDDTINNTVITNFGSFKNKLSKFTLANEIILIIFFVLNLIKIE